METTEAKPFYQVLVTKEQVQITKYRDANMPFPVLENIIEMKAVNAGNSIDKALGYMWDHINSDPDLGRLPLCKKNDGKELVTYRGKKTFLDACKSLK